MKPPPESSVVVPDSAQPADLLSRVISNDWVNARYKHLVVAAPPQAAQARPGQFFHLLCPDAGGEHPFFRRPMSCYGASPRQGTVEFLYKVAGTGTRSLASLVPGATLPMLGPLGHGFSLEPAWRTIVVVGRGVGLATLAPLAEAAAAAGIAVQAVFSARDRDSVMSVERFEASGARVTVVLDSDGSSDPAKVEALLRRLHVQGMADAFFTCGSTRLLVLLQRLGRELGVPGQVALEQQMACGLGMCFCCVRPFREDDEVVNRRVCWDGPVFDIQEAMP